MNDFLEGCISDVDPQKKDYAGFQETFCKRCRNSDCIHAKRANDAFTRRVQTQEDRLFNPPEVSDNTDPRYAMLTDFIDVSGVAEQMEVRSRPPQMMIPEIQVTDGRIENHDSQQVDDAVSRFRRKYEMPVDAPLELEPPVAAAPQKDPEPEGPRQQAPSLITRPGNTPVPAGGIILPGVPLSKPSAPPKQIIDPWAIPTEVGPKVVPAGATVKMEGEPK